MNAARRRSSALDKLEELRVVILEHILKTSILPKDPSVKHWQKELHSFASRLRKFNKAKAGNKPNYTQELLWEYIWEDQYTELPLGFVEEYEIHEFRVNMDDVKTRIQAFVDQVLEK